MNRGVRGRRLAAIFCLAISLGIALGGCQGEAPAAAPPEVPSGGQEVQPPVQSSPGQAPVPPAEPAALPYDFTRPVPEAEEAELEYFDDAAFVGDSRTDGLLLYSGIGRGKNLTSNGLSVFTLEKKKALTIGGEKLTVLEALALGQYGKVYLSLGINELGYYDDQGFYDSYCRAIDAIRAIQPRAVIYVQGLIPVNEEAVLQTSGRDYLTNEHLRTYNDLIGKAAGEKQVAFLDLYGAFADEDGKLPDGASRDGVHLTKEYCQQWLSYLRTHTVEIETLYPQDDGGNEW